MLDGGLSIPLMSWFAANQVTKQTTNSTPPLLEGKVTLTEAEYMEAQNQIEQDFMKAWQVDANTDLRVRFKHEGYVIDPKSDVNGDNEIHPWELAKECVQAGLEGKQRYSDYPTMTMLSIDDRINLEKDSYLYYYENLPDKLEEEAVVAEQKPPKAKAVKETAYNVTEPKKFKEKADAYNQQQAAAKAEVVKEVVKSGQADRLAQVVGFKSFDDAANHFKKPNAFKAKAE